MMYGGKVLHADPCRTYVGHGLGLISIGIVIGQKIVLLNSTLGFAANGWMPLDGRHAVPLVGKLGAGFP